MTRTHFFTFRMTEKLSFISVFILIFIWISDIQGQCISGNCNNGKGTYKFKDGSIYGGSFVKYFPHGYGKLMYKNGNVYEGEWKRGKKEGRGMLTFAKGNTYRGDFKNDVISGNGSMDYQNGDSYKGSWSANKSNGTGIYQFTNGDRYEGQFVSGFFDGFGIMYKKDGSRYEGHWHKNKKHGDGVLFLVNGNQIAQKFSYNTLLKEEEKVVVATQNSFETPAKNKVTNSKFKDCNSVYCDQEYGKYVYGDGSRYEGYFVGGEGSGQGKCWYAGGDVYSGTWKNHSPNGKGSMTFANGNRLSGDWEDGTLIRQDEVTSSITNAPQKQEVEKEKKPKIYSLIVGVATYNHTSSLKYTDDDAYRLYAFLKSPEGGALPDDQISILIDDAATRPAILKEMDRISEKAGENDVIIVYLSGHGLDGNFVPFDFDGKKNLVNYKELFTKLDRSDAKHKLFITDACHSGSMLAQARSPYEITLGQLYDAYALAEKGSAYLTSSKSEEVSLEYGGLRQGIFSHFLIRGLKGEANYDGDNIVTVEELYQYVSKEVKKYTAGAQNPSITGNYDPDMPVAMVRTR
ncbi:MAG: caspase family protein [Saprospiraceae bacterium]|nr:caspase family protein [Saprospiraceae bacterium]